MGGIDLVPAVNVPGAEEGIVPVLQVHRLVRRGVRAEEGVVGDVVCVRGGAARVVRLEAQVVEALLGGDDGVLGVEDLVLLGEGVEVLLDLRPDDADRVVGLGVEAAADEGSDVGRDVVVGVVGAVPLGNGVIDLLGDACHGVGDQERSRYRP